MKKRIRIFTKSEVWQWVMAKTNPATPAIATLFGGDRLACCDEGVALEVDDEIVGLATIAPSGEFGAGGQPTIVACYVRHEFRGQGYGYEIMTAAIDRMRERGLQKPYRADATSSPGLRVCQGLPEDYRADLQIHDMSLGGLTDLVMLM